MYSRAYQVSKLLLDARKCSSLFFFAKQKCPSLRRCPSLQKTFDTSKLDFSITHAKRTAMFLTPWDRLGNNKPLDWRQHCSMHQLLSTVSANLRLLNRNNGFFRMTSWCSLLKKLNTTLTIKRTKTLGTRRNRLGKHVMNCILKRFSASAPRFFSLKGIVRSSGGL